MITEKDLQEAIAECQGERHPNAATCIKLAAFYTIQEHMFGKSVQNEPMPDMRYSFSSSPETVETTINYFSDTDFSKAIDGQNASEVWSIMDELMSVLQTTNPRLYAGVLRKIDNI